jgi:hypothetical protein
MLAEDIDPLKYYTPADMWGRPTCQLGCSTAEDPVPLADHSNYYLFFRTRLITYFIKKVAITNRQVREQLAQQQRNI